MSLAKAGLQGAENIIRSSDVIGPFSFSRTAVDRCLLALVARLQVKRKHFGSTYISNPQTH